MPPLWENASLIEKVYLIDKSDQEITSVIFNKT